MFTFEAFDKLNKQYLKKQHQLIFVLFIGIITLVSWYFFVKKYTYEYEIDTPLDKAVLIEILNKTYPATHPDLVLVEAIDDEIIIFQYTDADVSFIQEIRIFDENSDQRTLTIGVNAQSHFFKERFVGLYKETLVQVFNQFLLLQLDQEIASKENLFQ